MGEGIAVPLLPFWCKVLIRVLGCTAKALMHRIGKIRVLASGRDGGKGKVKGKEGSGRKGGAGARVGGTEEEDSGGAGAANGGRSKKRKVGDEGRDVKEESAPVEAEINGGEGSGEDF